MKRRSFLQGLAAVLAAPSAAPVAPVAPMRSTALVPTEAHLSPGPALPAGDVIYNITPNVEILMGTSPGEIREWATDTLNPKN